jgi:hypothetical protein
VGTSRRAIERVYVSSDNAVVRAPRPPGSRGVVVAQRGSPNKCDDIQEIYLAACERLGVEARRNNRWSISVAKRQAVARLDELVGPKS